MLAQLLIAMAFLMIVVILALVWIVMRAAMSPGENEIVDGPSIERVVLLEEKKATLRALKDLELERALGKIDDADHQGMESRLRSRARQVLHALDEDLAPWREKAEALVAANAPAPTTEDAPPNKQDGEA